MGSSHLHGRKRAAFPVTTERFFSRIHGHTRSRSPLTYVADFASMSDVTQIIDAIEAGDPCAQNQLLEAAYQELHGVASRMMAQERAGHTLQPTALIHEAYLKMTGPSGCPPDWQSRKHFFSAAAEAMRRILIDHARRKFSQKRGGEFERTTWDEAEFELQVPTDELLAVHEALTVLESENADAAQVVKLRYFGGLTVEETAEALDSSVSTVNRLWRAARAWLYREIREQADEEC